MRPAASVVNMVDGTECLRFYSLKAYFMYWIRLVREGGYSGTYTSDVSHTFMPIPSIQLRFLNMFRRAPTDLAQSSY